MALCHFWSNQQIPVHLVWARPREDLLWVERVDDDKSFPQTHSLEILLVRYSVYAGSVHFWTSAAFYSRIVDSKQPFIQRKNNRLNKRLIFWASESSLCADKLIVCFSSSEQWGSVPCAGSHAFHCTIPWWQRKLGVKMNPEMSQKFGLSCVTQTWASHWSWQPVLWHNGKDLWRAMLMEP